MHCLIGCSSFRSFGPDPNPSPGPTPSPLFPQTKLDGNCLPKFVTSLPVFGPAGSVPRVDAAAHPNLTVTMKEIDQPVLPQGFEASCGAAGLVKLGPTRVWAYQTTDTNTGTVLGPASWPAVTIVSQRGTATRVQYVNQLPSFNSSNPGGPGLVQGVLPFGAWSSSIHKGKERELSTRWGQRQSFTSRMPVLAAFGYCYSWGLALSRTNSAISHT